MSRHYCCKRKSTDEESYADEEELQICDIKHYEEAPDVTLSARNGTSHTESAIPVRKQRSFAGVDGMLETLSSPVDTLRNPLYKASRFSRASKIKNAPARRVWDLYANRVVPYWTAIKYPWAMSHAWVDKNGLKRAMTPMDADLDLIRIEVLNLGAEGDATEDGSQTRVITSKSEFSAGLSYTVTDPLARASKDTSSSSSFSNFQSLIMSPGLGNEYRSTPRIRKTFI
ncbi:hypothetical protein IW262DRAFT_1296032 [Armillaria fumosa]|nr:hypothetical protein IW262DRAFT_1296032 [Armillaria fumosa]